MRAAILIAALLVSACETTSAPEQWGRDDGQPASAEDKQRFARDEAACEYDLARTQAMSPNRPVATIGAFRSTQAVLGSAMLSGPPPQAFALCMRARGWVRRS